MNLSYRNERNAKAAMAFWGKSENTEGFSIKSLSDNETEIFLYDVVGWPFNDSGILVRQIAGLSGQDITVRVNSPGGDVFDGMAIFNALAGHSGNLTIRIESLAASMASVIAMSSKKNVQAYPTSMIMIHEPWAYSGGNQHDHAEISNILGKINENMVGVYSEKTGLGKKNIREMLKAETWLTAAEAKEKGFINEIITAGKPAKAAFDLSVFNHAPETKETDVTVREIEKALRDAGLSRTNAKAIIARGIKAIAEETDNGAALMASLKKLENTMKGINP